MSGTFFSVPFTYTPSEEIGSASPTTCTGGNLYSTACSVNPEYRDTYMVESCPLSTYICPGYGQNFESYEQYTEDKFPNVVFGEATPPSVSIRGVDLIRGGEEQIDQIRVPYPTYDGEKNVSILWYTENVTECECMTSDKEICTPLDWSTVSIWTGVPVYAASGPKNLNGEYSLTSDTTFTVTCD